MGKRKSDHYNWFNSSNNGPKKPAKVFWKRAFKITKIVTYSSLFTLSMVGCVQTFVIKSDTKTGSGLEFYKSKNAVAPHVVTLKEEEIYSKTTKKDYKKISNTGTDTNYWLQKQSVLDQLHKQNENVGKWRSKTQTLRVQDKDKKSTTSTPIVKDIAKNKFFVANNTDSKYTYLNDKTTPLYSIVDKSKNLAALIVKGAVWGKIDKIIFPTKSPTKNPTPTINELQTQAKVKPNNIEQNFAVDTYAYLSTQYLADTIPAIKPTKDGAKVSVAWQTWINNYMVISQTTGWRASYNKDNVKNDFSYTNKKGQIPPLSFETIKEQRAVYSWKGAWALGPFYGLFVYPLAFLTGKLISSLPSMSGWEAIIAIMIVVILVRTLAYAISFKSTLQTVKQQEVQAKVAIINAKYEPYKGNKQMDRRKQQEVSELYKKEGVSALGAFSQIFITMPIFLSMWRVIAATPSLKSTIWLGINFASTSWRELIKGGWQYLPLMLVTALVQGVQIISPRLFSKRREKNRVNIYQKQAMKKSNKTQNIMTIAFIVIALVLSAGVQVYWFFTGLYTIGQNTVNHYIIKHQSKNRKRKTGY